MPRDAFKEYIRSRPSIFWWTLANALAAAFAIASWSVCLYLFNFPERPTNYEILRKVNRLTAIVAHDPLEAPEGLGAGPQDLLKKFYSLPPDQLAAHNRIFMRNYLTNFRKPEVVSYVEGTYRVTGSRALTPDDFFHPGLAIRAQATVLPAEAVEASLYPVILEILLPLDAKSAPDPFPPSHEFVLTASDHRALILHAARLGSDNAPSVCLTVVPIAFLNWNRPDGSPLRLSPPDPLNLKAPFPVLEENRPR